MICVPLSSREIKIALRENICIHLFHFSVPPSSHVTFISGKHLLPCSAQMLVSNQVQLQIWNFPFLVPSWPYPARGENYIPQPPASKGLVSEWTSFDRAPPLENHHSLWISSYSQHYDSGHFEVLHPFHSTGLLLFCDCISGLLIPWFPLCSSFGLKSSLFTLPVTIVLSLHGFVERWLPHEGFGVNCHDKAEEQTNNPSVVATSSKRWWVPTSLQVNCMLLRISVGFTYTTADSYVMTEKSVDLGWALSHIGWLWGGLW